MRLLITSDLHLTDQPRDIKRFGLFSWLLKQQEIHASDAVLILGDITDKKDRHSSDLVNKIVGGLMKLKPPVIILKGNHDYIDPENPFFKFLNCIDGIRFITKVCEPIRGHWMIPHCRNQDEFDRAVAKIAPKSDGVFCHATFEGAIAETGARLAGLRASLSAFRGAKGVWSGDVHKPQQAGPVVYVGSPYHVRFGDQFNPRVLLVKGGASKDLHFECPRKWKLTLNDADDIANHDYLRKDDQVRITIQLHREEVVDWAAHKRRVLDHCKELELEVFGVKLEVEGSTKKPETKPQATTLQPADLLADFCKREKVAADIRKVGLAILRG